MSLQDNRLTVEEFQVQKDKQTEMIRLADRLGCTVAQLSLAWCLKNEHVQCVLLGAATPEQLVEQLSCLQVRTDFFRYCSTYTAYKLAIHCLHLFAP
jgi:potassium voltage-gated channel Shaker-related subfamily A beta protein 2